jgi:hypothetical protein
MDTSSPNIPTQAQVAQGDAAIEARIANIAKEAAKEATEKALARMGMAKRG